MVHGARGGVCQSLIKESVLDIKVGKFVILGRAKKNTQKQEKFI
jgi:hypothetical protein